MTAQRLSQILKLPLTVADSHLVNAKHILSRSTKLFSEQGLVRLQDGKAAIMPFVLRSVRKLENILREEMEKVHAIEMVLPIMFDEGLLVATGRHTRDDLFKVKDSKKNLVLSATNEEAITYILATSKISHSALPLKFYQINTKFRNEPKPKHGLIRSKEFLMKDLYCFDVDEEHRMQTYKEIVNQYHNLFKRLKLPYVSVQSSAPDMLVNDSNEFHLLSNIGEDSLLLCQNCDHKSNINLAENLEKCSMCSSNNIKLVKGIEVGHTFNIGTVYSKKLNACYTTPSHNFKLLEMTCYGIGVTRLVAAAAEVLSSDTNLKWPIELAPFKICVLLPKAGSWEESEISQSLPSLCAILCENFPGDVAIDDRTSYTVGKRLYHLRKLGFPLVVIAGRTMIQSMSLELQDLYTNETFYVNQSEIVKVIKERISLH